MSGTVNMVMISVSNVDIHVDAIVNEEPPLIVMNVTWRTES